MNNEELQIMKKVDRILKYEKKAHYKRLSETSDSTEHEDSPLINKSDNNLSSDNDNIYMGNQNENNKFNQCIREVECAIRKGIVPEMISQGSSGSYFVKNKSGKICGVFKPKDEEPYGQLNPKWTKWFHKHCLPCCFGRSCLVPNQGYLSEAGASLVDDALNLNIVPRTRVVRLASSVFNYTRIDRAKMNTKRQIVSTFPGMAKKFHRLGLPPKVGSLQIFVENYRESSYWLGKFDSETLPEQTYRKFHYEFEKLVILDYIIRNTDRGSDNWLVKYVKPDCDPINGDTGEMDFALFPEIKIAAIDNGLAFPWKQPDEWRSYPFHWSNLEMAKTPFSDDIKNLVLNKLKDDKFVERLCHSLYELFKTDKGFDYEVFKKQMGVMRGQILNLSNCLDRNMSPWDLVNMTAVSMLKGTDFKRQQLKNPELIVHEPEYDENDYVTTYHKRALFDM